MTSSNPRVSILVSTFDRPDLTFQALEAIARQSFTDYEVVLLDDGSTEETKARYRELQADSAFADDTRLRWVFMPSRDTRLSNLSIARNNAIAEARGELITFCDDDDFWIDDEHLATGVAEFKKHPDLDFFFADQQGVQAGELKLPVWQPGLKPDLASQGVTADENGIYDIPLAVFCRHWTPHTNTTLFRRELIDSVGPFWPYTPMEQDVDFFYRAADQARRIRFRDVVVCTHEIPDKSKKANSSSRVSQAERYRYRLGIAAHLLTSTRSPEVRGFARDLNRYAAQKLADELVADGKAAAALHFAWRGFCARPSPGGAKQCFDIWRKSRR